MRLSYRKLGMAVATALLTIPASAELHIGVILSLTGPAASLGIPARNAVQMWPKEVAGQPIKVTLLDDTSDTTAAAVVARKLVQEGKVDVIVGPSVTPTSLAALQVAAEHQTTVISLAGGSAIVQPLEGPKKWAFKMPPEEEISLKRIYDHMRSQKQTRLALVAANNAYGQTYVDVAQRTATAAGVQIVGVERYNPTDQSFVAQSIKLQGYKADGILIAASGTPAALPQLELRNRGYKGTIFQTQAVANNDFLRLGGAKLDGTLLPVSPLLVAEQLPASNEVRTHAMQFANLYEKQYGSQSLSLFAGTAWDAMTLIQTAMPAALKKATPGTVEFRQALRDALENTKNMVLTQGVYTMSATNHNGADERSQVLVRIQNGKWVYEPQ